MILVTGGAGFIGSVLIWKLNELGIDQICVVDHFGTSLKWKNLAKRRFAYALNKDDLFPWLAENGRSISAVFHMGACSSTTELDVDYLIRNNFQYSTRLFEFCARTRVPFIYASSAATYGDGEKGYGDNMQEIPFLRPVNAYGFSKQIFDAWVLKQKVTPSYWAGLKFFNVYGPQEYHKGKQSSVIFQAVSQIREEKKLRLFKSYRPGIAHGEQRRDFIYVKDAVNVMMHLYHHRATLPSGVFNIGTGKARSFADLGRAVFQSMNAGSENFEWIEMPEEMRDRYQYFTEANLDNLRSKANFETAFHSLEEGIKDYVQNYLMRTDSFL